MRDLITVATIVVCMIGIILYVTAESPRQSRVLGCYGKCYEEYKQVHGTLMEQVEKQAEAAAADPFSSIRGLWAGCAACHGQNGQGMGAFPRLAGQSAEDIISKLTTYKNRGEIGNMSSTMWAQASVLSETDIDTLGRFVEETMNE
tara:strand:- start:4491 stop:4928 length:438 start_codon:yes stop_codon:yes gene_type:complete